jgi:hypothetical protein
LSGSLVPSVRVEVLLDSAGEGHGAEACSPPMRRA